MWIHLLLLEALHVIGHLCYFSVWYRAEAIKKANGLLFPEEVRSYFDSCVCLCFSSCRKFFLIYTFLAQYYSSHFYALDNCNFGSSTSKSWQLTFIRSSVSGLFNF